MRTGTLTPYRDGARLVLHHSLTILGSGYTAKFLLQLAARRYRHVFATSRNPERHLNYLKTEQQIRFDLVQPDTWASIPTETDILWCFPAVPIELVKRFADTQLRHVRRLVVLGSTSAYNDDTSTAYPPPWVNESTPIDLAMPRVQGEELLRTDYGAIVLRVAGIYGPGRNPIDWIQTGRVHPSRKYVNLIHVEDLSAICLAALLHGRPGEVYNVSDGIPRTWNEIYGEATRRWNIESTVIDGSTLTGKRVANTKMRSLLELDQRELVHKDLFEALAVIRSHPVNEAGPSR